MVAADGDLGLSEAAGLYILKYVARARASRHQPPHVPEGAVFLYTSLDDTGPAVRGRDAEPEWRVALGKGSIY